MIAFEGFASAAPRAHRRQQDLAWTVCGLRFPVLEQHPGARPLYFSLAGLRGLLPAVIDVRLLQTRDHTT